MKLTEVILKQLKDRPEWDLNQIKGYIGSLRNHEDNKDIPVFYPPNEPAVGDVVSFNIQGSLHPCIIFKIDKEKDKYFGICLSSTDGVYCVKKVENSRLFHASYFTNLITIQSREHIMKNWRGLFDSPSELKEVIKILKKAYNKLLTI